MEVCVDFGNTPSCLPQMTVMGYCPIMLLPVIWGRWPQAGGGVPKTYANLHGLQPSRVPGATLRRLSLRGGWRRAGGPETPTWQSRIYGTASLPSLALLGIAASPGSLPCREPQLLAMTSPLCPSCLKDLPLRASKIYANLHGLALPGWSSPRAAGATLPRCLSASLDAQRCRCSTMLAGHPAFRHLGRAG